MKPLFIFITTILVSQFTFADGDAHENDVMLQVLEGLSLGNGVKAAVAEFYHGHGRYPVSNTEAGLVEPHLITGEYVASATVLSVGGKISIAFSVETAPEITSRTLLLVPTDTDGSISWECLSPNIDDKYLPMACKKNQLNSF